jgi:hypothetical protein
MNGLKAIVVPITANNAQDFQALFAWRLGE